MSNVQSHIDKLEGLLARVQLRAAEPRVVAEAVHADEAEFDEEEAPISGPASSDPMRSPMATLVGVAPAPASMTDARPPAPRHAQPDQEPAASAARVVAAPVVDSGPTVEIEETDDEYGVEVSSELVEVDVDVGDDDLIEDQGDALAAASHDDPPISSKRAITLPPERDPFAEPPTSGRQMASAPPPYAGWHEPGLADESTQVSTGLRAPSHAQMVAAAAASASAPTSITQPELPVHAAVAQVIGQLASEGDASFGVLLDHSLSL